MESLWLAPTTACQILTQSFLTRMYTEVKYVEGAFCLDLRSLFRIANNICGKCVYNFQYTLIIRSEYCFL
jgi:hypothetical protein